MFDSRDYANSTVNKHDKSLHLSYVAGFTSTSNNSFCYNKSIRSFSYVAGCSFVVRSIDSQFQKVFHANIQKNTLTCIDFSHGAKLVATGEAGNSPKVLVYDIDAFEAPLEFSGHKFAINSVKFSTNINYLISIGCNLDQNIFVWNITTKMRCYSSRISHIVNSLTFMPNGRVFITVANRSVRYFEFNFIDAPNSVEAMPLTFHNAILKNYLNQNFIDVSAYEPQNDNNNFSTFIIILSSNGHLLKFDEKRKIVDHIQLEIIRATCLSSDKEYSLIGGQNGITLLVTNKNFKLLHKFPMPHTLCSSISEIVSYTDQDQNTATHLDSNLSHRYPGIIACRLDIDNGVLVTLLSDRSLYIWKLGRNNRGGSWNASLQHRDCYHGDSVWAVESFSEGLENLFQHLKPSQVMFLTDLRKDTIFKSCFLTSSEDCTVRAWSIVSQCQDSKFEHLGNTQVQILPIGIYYSNPLKTSSLVSSKKLIMGPINSVPDSQSDLVQFFGSAGASMTNQDAPVILSSNQKVQTSSVLSTIPTSATHGIRALKVSPCGRHLAIADRKGCIRILDLYTGKVFHNIKSHESEILSLDYIQSEVVPELTLFCSSSRDRMVHIYDPGQKYSLMQTLNDHSAAVFNAKFVEHAHCDDIRLITCSADHSLLIRSLEPNENGDTAKFVMTKNICERSTLYDATLISRNIVNKNPNSSSTTSKISKYLAVVGQSSKMLIYNTKTGKKLREVRVCNNGIHAVRCAADSTGSLIAVATSDKLISIHSFTTGEKLTTVGGHSENCSSLCFLRDGSHLISTSTDGCVFVWRLGLTLKSRILDNSYQAYKESNFTSHSTIKLSEDLMDSVHSVFEFCSSNLEKRKTPMSFTQSYQNLPEEDKARQISASSFRFSVSALPAWARRKMSLQQSSSESFSSALDTIHNDTITERTIGPQEGELPLDPDSNISHSCSAAKSFDVMTTSAPPELFESSEIKHSKTFNKSETSFIYLSSDKIIRPSTTCPAKVISSQNQSQEMLDIARRETNRRLSEINRQVKVFSTRIDAKKRQLGLVNNTFKQQFSRVNKKSALSKILKEFSFSISRTYANPTIASKARCRLSSLNASMNQYRNSIGIEDCIANTSERTRWISDKNRSNTRSHDQLQNQDNNEAGQFSSSEATENGFEDSIFTRSSNYFTEASPTKNSSKWVVNLQAILNKIRDLYGSAIKICENVHPRDQVESPNLVELKRFIEQDLDHKYLRLRSQIGLGPLTIDLEKTQLLVSDIVGILGSELREIVKNNQEPCNARKSADWAISSSTNEPIECPNDETLQDSIFNE